MRAPMKFKHPLPVLLSALRDPAVKIAGIYLILGSLWIFFSDRLVTLFFSEIHMMTLLNISKGLLYVIITTLLLFSLIRASFRKLRISEEKYRLIHEKITDVIVIYNYSKKKATYISPSFFDRMPISSTIPAEVTMDQVLTPESVKLYSQELDDRAREFQGQATPSLSFINQVKVQAGQKEIWAEFCSTLHYNNEGEIEVLVVGRNIEERKRAEEEILRLSYRDHLTGVYNHRFYVETLPKMESEQYFPLGLVMLDVNCLKLANDVFGHSAGDTILKKTARILTEHCRKEDILARVGGDEFILLLPNMTPKQVQDRIARIHAALAREETEECPFSVSIGYAMKTDLFTPINDCVCQAEDEMYRHKLSANSHSHSRTIDMILDSLGNKNTFDPHHPGRASQIRAAVTEALRAKGNHEE